MFHYRVTIAYKGTHYRGWQAQSKLPSAELAPTIQGTIHGALRRISKYQDCAIQGCSRTDAGVHARGQIGKISIPKEVEADTLLQGLNSVLPGDIRIVECARCEQSFNPKLGATSKEYHYYFSTDPVADPVLGDVVAHLIGSFDLDRMQEAAGLFVGKHDFMNFYRRSSQAATTTREIYACQICQSSSGPGSGPGAGQVHYLRIVGNGSLKQMIRYLAGAIFDAGRGRVTASQIQDYLRHEHSEKLSAAVKAKGLHLISIAGL